MININTKDELEAFKKKCRAMSLEIDYWREHIGIEKKRLDDGKIVMVIHILKFL